MSTSLGVTGADAVGKSTIVKRESTPDEIGDELTWWKEKGVSKHAVWEHWKGVMLLHVSRRSSSTTIDIGRYIFEVERKVG